MAAHAVVLHLQHASALRPSSLSISASPGRMLICMYATSHVCNLEALLSATMTSRASCELHTGLTVCQPGLPHAQCSVHKAGSTSERSSWLLSSAVSLVTIQ